MTKEEYSKLSEEEKAEHCRGVCWAMVREAEKSAEKKGSGNHGTYVVTHPFNRTTEDFRDIVNNLTPETAKQLEAFAAEDKNS